MFNCITINSETPVIPILNLLCNIIKIVVIFQIINNFLSCLLRLIKLIVKISQ